MGTKQILILTTLGLLAATAPARLSAQGHDPDAKVAGGGPFPAGWHVRTDKDKPATDVRFVKLGNGFHVTLGPAVVLWRDADRVRGNYRVSATFTQTKNPRHPEGYGLVIGGSHLGDAKNRYTYFLLRGDGKFLVKRRVFGDSTVQVTSGWTPSDAVVRADTAGRATNELAVAVAGGKVSFLANGTEVYSADASDLDTQGLVGYRVNHNLDVHVSALTIHKR